MTDVADVARAAAAARQAWPALAEPPGFVARLAEALAGGGGAGGRVHADDLYLACACAGGDPAALAAFDRAVLPQISGAVRRIDPSPDFADEVRQAVRARLLVGDAGEPPRIAGYAGRGPLVAWVRVAAVRLALALRDRRRREAPVAHAGDDVGDLAALDPELALLKARYAGELEEALRRAGQALTERERALLRLAFADGLNVDQVGDVYGVHRATAARWIARARERLFELTRDDLRARLALSPTEFDSVVRLVRSQVELTLTRFFGATDP
ncbi:MAG: sigma-70 family RNA polymerase sigma factor [Myxococcales bacterium]|nr:sigma-70 family RNA polymerase sigma factor [Myxococcales bacterium]